MLASYSSISEAGRDLGFDPGVFRSICSGWYTPNTIDRKKLQKRFGELGIPALIPRWSRRLAKAVDKNYGNAQAAAAALCIGYTALRRYISGVRVPNADMQAILTSAFPKLRLPPPPPDRFAARLAEMVAKQQAELESTGHLPTYLLSEIAGNTMSRERVRQIIVWACRSLRIRLGAENE